jgi:hypothetical protein
LFFNQEKRVREIVLKAMGQAINKTVAIAEIIKVVETLFTIVIFINMFRPPRSSIFTAEKDSWVAPRYLYQLDKHH